MGNIGVNAAIILTYYHPYISGVSIYARRLAKRLANSGIQVTVLTSGEQNYIEEDGEIKIIRCQGRQIRKIFLYNLAYWGKLIKTIKNNDWINIHMPYLEAGAVAILAKLYGKKVLITYHCSFDFYNPVLNTLVRIYDEFIGLMADKIIVNTKDYLEGYGLLKWSRNKVIEAWPPIEIEGKDIEEKVKIKKLIGGQTGELVVGYFGRISKEKRIEHLIRAIEIVKQKTKVKLAIGGSRNAVGEEDYGKKIDKMMAKVGGVMVGKVNKISSFFDNCDLVVIPSFSRMESFGMAGAEAIGHGVRVVTVNAPGVRQVVINTKMGTLAVNEKAEAIASAIMIELKESKKAVKVTFPKTEEVYLKILKT